MGEEEPEEYIVEQITDVKYSRERGCFVYFIKWQDYSENDNTWEPEAHLSHCPLILRNFKLGERFKVYVERVERRGIQLTEEDTALPEIPPALALPIQDETNSCPVDVIDTDYPKIVGACKDDEGNTQYLLCIDKDTKPKRIRREEALDYYKDILLEFLEQRLVDKKVYETYIAYQ